MPPPHAIETLYTPQQYECKLLYQSWKNFIRTDCRKNMENCDDPPDLHNNPITLTRLIEPGVQPPLMPKYFSGCNLKVQFHIMSKNIQANNMFERFLILSISLPETAYPSHLPSSRIQDQIWPDTYQYEYDVSSRTTKKIQGTI